MSLLEVKTLEEVLQSGDRSLFRKVVIPKGRYSEGSLFRKVVIPKKCLNVFSPLSRRNSCLMSPGGFFALPRPIKNRRKK